LHFSPGETVLDPYLWQRNRNPAWSKR